MIIATEVSETDTGRSWAEFKESCLLVLHKNFEKHKEFKNRHSHPEGSQILAGTTVGGSLGFTNDPNGNPPQTSKPIASHYSALGTPGHDQKNSSRSNTWRSGTEADEDVWRFLFPKRSLEDPRLGQLQSDVNKKLQLPGIEQSSALKPGTNAEGGGYATASGGRPGGSMNRKKKTLSRLNSGAIAMKDGSKMVTEPAVGYRSNLGQRIHTAANEG